MYGTEEDPPRQIITPSWRAVANGPISPADGVSGPDIRVGNITNDLLEFDPATLAWRTVEPGSGIVKWASTTVKPSPGAPVLPAARARAAFFAAQGGLFVFSGLGVTPRLTYGAIVDGEQSAL